MLVNTDDFDLNVNIDRNKFVSFHDQRNCFHKAGTEALLSGTSLQRSYILSIQTGQLTIMLTFAFLGLC